MIYVWENNLGDRIEVDRKISEYNTGPTIMEIVEWAEKNDKDLTKVTEWTRLMIGGSFTINFNLKGKYNSES